MRASLGFGIVALVACGSVQNNMPMDASADAPDAKTTIQVSPSGDNAADGLTAPVKTLKQAIALATSNGTIKTISLAAGKYGTANGETYPYTVPANITIVGAPGAMLVGTKAEVGLVLDTGTLQNLELDDFMTAVHSTGAGTLTGVTVKTSMIGVLADGTAKLTGSAVTLAGTAGQCTNVGLQASATAQVAIDTFTATTTGVILNQIDQSVVSIAKGTITGDPACTANQPLMAVSGKTLTLIDTMMSGGHDGISFSGTPAVALTNTTIADTADDALVGHAATFQMTGGELRNNARGGGELVGGTYTFTNVGLKGNPVFGIYLQLNSAGPGTITMRGCTINGNGNGVYLFDGAVADFGTATSPGNNTFQGNAHVGLSIDGNSGARLITAVGNTWQANTQGANAQGKYGTQTVSGPVAAVDGNNFHINSGWSLQF